MPQTQYGLPRAPRYADFLRYLVAHDVNNVCNSCSQPNWAIGLLAEGGPTYQWFGTYGWDAKARLEPLNVIAMECTHCGYMRFYSANKVGFWIAQNPAWTSSI
jgi:hypothetical protein